MYFVTNNTGIYNNHKHITAANIQTCWNLSQKPAFSDRQFCVVISYARNGCNMKFNKQTTSENPF